MSSKSEKKLSVDELKQRNLPTEPASPMACPAAEQWEELLTYLGYQYRAMTAQANATKSALSTMQILAAQTEKLVAAATETNRLLQQAGSKKERWHLPKIHLPTLSLAWLWVIPILAVSAILWYALATLWSEITPLLRLLP